MYGSNGKSYTCASKQKIRDQGFKNIVVDAVGLGQTCMKFRVASVNGPLRVVSDMVDAGCRVTFEAVKHGNDISTLVNKWTGKSTPLIRRGGVYDLVLHVMPYAEAKKLRPSSPNVRHAKR